MAPWEEYQAAAVADPTATTALKPWEEYAAADVPSLDPQVVTPEDESLSDRIKQFLFEPEGAKTLREGIQGAVEAIPHMAVDTAKMGYKGLRMAMGTPEERVKIMTEDVIPSALGQGQQTAADVQSPFGTSEWLRGATQLGMMAAPGLELVRELRAPVEIPREIPPVQVEPTLAERITQPRVEPVVEEPLAPVTPEVPLEPPVQTPEVPATAPEAVVPSPVAAPEAVRTGTGFSPERVETGMQQARRNWIDEQRKTNPTFAPDVESWKELLPPNELREVNEWEDLRYRSVAMQGREQGYKPYKLTSKEKARLSELTQKYIPRQQAEISEVVPSAETATTAQPLPPVAPPAPAPVSPDVPQPVSRLDQMREASFSTTLTPAERARAQRLIKTEESKLGKLKAYVEKSKKLGQQVDPKVEAKIAEIEGVPPEAPVQVISGEYQQGTKFSPLGDSIRRRINTLVDGPLNKSTLGHPQKGLPAFISGDVSYARDFAREQAIKYPDEAAKYNKIADYIEKEFVIEKSAPVSPEAPVQAQEAPSIASEAPGGVPVAETPLGAAEPPPPGAGAPEPSAPRLPTKATDLTEEQFATLADEFQAARKEANKIRSWPAYKMRIGEEVATERLQRFSELRNTFEKIGGFKDTRIHEGAAGRLDSQQITERTVDAAWARRFHRKQVASEPPSAAPPPEVPPSERGYAGMEPLPQKPSKIGQSIEAKAVEAKLTKGFPETAGYDPITIKDQAARASNLVKQNPSRAGAIIRGEEPLPPDIKGTSLITAVEEHLVRNPDPQLAYELANSRLVSLTSEAAQEMRLMAERVPDGITAKFAEIKKAREEGAALRKETKAKVKKEINGEVVKAASKRPTWEQFVKEIVC